TVADTAPLVTVLVLVPAAGLSHRDRARLGHKPNRGWWAGKVLQTSKLSTKQLGDSPSAALTAWSAPDATAPNTPMARSTAMIRRDCSGMRSSFLVWLSTQTSLLDPRRRTGADRGPSLPAHVVRPGRAEPLSSVGFFMLRWTTVSNSRRPVKAS